VGEGPTYRASAFNDVCKLYSKYPKRFYIYCSLDLSGVDKPGFGPATIKDLERCHKMDAVGVGEIHDKGMGIGGVIGGPANWPGTRKGPGGTARPPATPIQGFHPDAPQLDAIWEKYADLGMPVNLHVSDPYWSYLPQNRFNDGLMNGFSWRLDNKPGIMGHNDLIESFEAAAKRHRRTVFIASHLANLDYDLPRLGQIFDRNPNLCAGISRVAETAPNSTVRTRNGHVRREREARLPAGARQSSLTGSAVPRNLRSVHSAIRQIEIDANTIPVTRTDPGTVWYIISEMMIVKTGAIAVIGATMMAFP
jgi:hypothetical protein